MTQLQRYNRDKGVFGPHTLPQMLATVGSLLQGQNMRSVDGSMKHIMGKEDQFAELFATWQKTFFLHGNSFSALLSRVKSRETKCSLTYYSYFCLLIFRKENNTNTASAVTDSEKEDRLCCKSEARMPCRWSYPTQRERAQQLLFPSSKLSTVCSLVQGFSIP